MSEWNPTFSLRYERRELVEEIDSQVSRAVIKNVLQQKFIRTSKTGTEYKWFDVSVEDSK